MSDEEKLSHFTDISDSATKLVMLYLVYKSATNEFSVSLQSPVSISLTYS